MEKFFKQKTNTKYTLIIFLVLLFLLLIWLVIYLFPPLSKNLPPLPAHPVSIVETKKIYDLGSNHYCEITPFTQTMTDKQNIYQINLYPSNKNSGYELEVGNLPKD